MIRIKPFVIAQTSRLQNLARSLSSDLTNAIRNLSSDDILSLFNTFVPLDFIALVSLLNKRAFDKAINTLVHRRAVGKIRSIERKDIEGSDLAQKTFVNLLGSSELGSEDRSGILAKTLDQGSRSREFNYVPSGKTKKEKEDRREVIDLIRNSVKANSQGILVPYCPHDLELGKEHLLWDVNTSGGKIKIKPGYDETNRCTSFEEVENPENLSNEQQLALDRGLRTLEQQGGKWVLRCTFKEKLSTFSSFITPRVEQALTQTVSQIDREKDQKKFERKEYQELYILKNKIDSGTASSEDKKRYQKLSQKLEKVEKSRARMVDLDKPLGEEGRTLHETIPATSITELADPETVRVSTTNLIETVGEGFLHATRLVSLKPLILLMKDIVDTPLKDPARIQKKQQLKQGIRKAVIASLTSQEPEITYCADCKNPLEEGERCFYAEEMQNKIYTLYLNNKSATDLGKDIMKLDPRIQAHFHNAGLKEQFSTLLDQQNDLLEQLGLGMDDSSEKLSEQEFNTEIEKKLNDQQRRSYVGSNIEKSTQVDEIQLQQVEELSSLIEKGLEEVFAAELEEDLVIYLEAFGA